MKLSRAHLVIALTLAGFIHSNPVRADDSGLRWDPVLVTARQYPLPVAQTPGGLGLIDGDDMEGRRFTSVSDLAPLVPGVSRTADGAWGADLSVRGLSRDSVVLMIDGIRLNTATDIGARFGMIDPATVERVEILKGPVSSLYGSGSLGGVVHIMTRSPHYPDRPESQGNLRFSAGSNPKGREGSARGEYADQHLYLSLSQGFRDSASYKDGDGHVVRNTQFDDRDTSFRAGWRWNDQHRLEFQTQYYVGLEIGIPGSGTAPLPALADVTYPRIRRRLFALTQVFTPESEVWTESSLKVYRHDNTRRVRIDHFPDASPILELRPGADHETSGTQWTHRLTLGDHTLVGGMEWWERRMDSFRERHMRNGAIIMEKPLPYVRYRSAGLFLEDRLEWGQSTLSGGARLDSIRTANRADGPWEKGATRETSWNVHFGASFSFDDHWTVKGIAARGYRAAGLEERFKYLNLGDGREVWGNPDLDPEASLFFETGLHWKNEDAAITVSTFSNHLENLITERVLTPRRNVMDNVREARIQGIELEASHRFSTAWRGYGNAAWARGEDVESGEVLPGVAPLNGLLGLRHENQNGFWTAMEWVGAIRQSRRPTGIAGTGSWETLDFRAGWNRPSGQREHRFDVGIRNLFNVAYRDYLSSARGVVFNEPGRSFHAGYEYRF